MMNSQGPVYIHCTEGKERTGFVCVLLEALAGASYDEIGPTENVNYSDDAARYLIVGGMTEKEVQQLKVFLTE